MKRSTQQGRLKWNLRGSGGGGQHCIVAHTGGSNLQLAAETCAFFERSTAVHGTLMYHLLSFIN